VTETPRLVDDTASAQRSGRLTSLDGLRGLAALIVVFHHLSLSLVPFSDVWIVPTATHPATGSLTWWMTSTPAQLLIAGPEAVLVFFVLSGLVVTLPVLSRPGFDWIAYYPQRMARLYLPVIGSIVLAAILIVATSWSTQPSSSQWIAASRFHLPTWTQVLGATDLLFGDTRINNPLWTLRWEVVFSLFLPLFVIVAVVTRRLWWVVIIASIPLVGIGIVAENGSFTFLPVFLVGAVIAVKLADLQAWADRHDGERWWPWLGAGVLAVSLLLLNLHWTLWGALGGPPRFQAGARAFEFIGALGLVLLAALWRPAIRLLSTRVFRWLGRVSFSLYLVHVPVIIAIDSLFGRDLPVARIAISLVLSIVFAELFSRFVEQPAHALSRRIGAGSARVLHGWFSRSPAE
jgi:peptidoglycan/LPS O-acetylase OafA/YrhL